MALKALTTRQAFDAPPLQSASRASWSGQLATGPHLLPVKAYSAVVAAPASSLHQVHICGRRIQQRRVCPEHGEVLAEEIRKAFTIAESDHLVLTDEDLAQLRPSGDGPIRVEHLLRGPQMDLSLLSGRTLHLVPAHAAAESGYAAINHVLAKSDLWAIGAGCLGDSRVPVALRSVEGRLQLHVLHWPRERRACPGFGTPALKISSESIRALERLLPDWQKPFRWTDYVDEVEQRLAQLVQEKLAARSRQTDSKRRTRITGSASYKSSAPARRAA